MTIFNAIQKGMLSATLVAMSAFAVAGNSSSDSTLISLSVNYYLAISFVNANDLIVMVTDGGQAGTYTSTPATFSVATNSTAIVKTSLAFTGPGSWTSLLSPNNASYVSGGTGYSLPTGPSTGYVKVQASNLHVTSIGGHYTGTLVLTVSQN
jgi:hypothetical protein